jgi:hypothetical protein
LFGRASSLRGTAYSIEMPDDSIPDILTDQLVLR